MEAKMEQTLGTNANPVLSVDKNGTVLYSNEAAMPLLNGWGLKVGEKLPSTIGDIVQRVISRNSPEKIEVKAGKKTYLVVFSPLPKQECVNISGFDISDQKDVEEKLRESENKYRNIVETSVEGIWIFNAVSETTYVNEKMAEMLGYNREEMIGRFIWDFASEENKSIFQIKLVNRKQGIDEIYKLELIRKDGSSVWFSVSAKGFFDDAGKFAGSVGMFTDITERKKVEEALQESKARVESIFRSSPVGIGVVVDRIIKEANERLCEITGYSREELLGKSALLLYPTAEEYERVGLIKYDMILERGTGYVETRWQRKDGSVVDILLSSSPIAPGDLCGEITFTALDITERKHAEETLVFERSQLLSIFDGMDDVVYVTDPYTYEVLYTNKEMKEKFGGELVGGICYQEFQQKDLPCYFCTNSIILKEKGKPYNWEYYNPMVDRFFMIMDRIIKWPDGRDVRLEIAKDITERKQLEEQTRQRAEELETLMDVVPVAIFIGHDPECHNITGNHMANELYEAKSGENVSANVCNLRRIFHKGIELTADELPMQNAAYEDIDVRNEELVWILPSGERLAVIGSASPLHDAKGNVRGSIGAFIDITERKQMEDKLKKSYDNLEAKVKERTKELEITYKSLKDSEEKYRNIVETANEGIALVNSEGVITYVNEKMSDMLGYTVGEIIGRHTWDFVEDKSTAIMLLENRSKGITDSIEIKQIRKDGLPLWVRINSKPIFDNNGKFMGSLGMFTDITERKKAEEVLNNIEIARKKEIHHRIKNNLQVISSLLDLQAEKLKNRKCIKDCQIECIRNSEVINAFKESQDRVISMALIHEELHKGGELDKLNFSHYIEELADNLLLTYRVGNEGISLNMDIEEDIFLDMDTSVPLGIIVNELVSNSLKHAFTGRNKGEIQIKLCREGSNTSFVLIVSDDGIGIHEDIGIEDLDSLGLQLVFTLVEQLDGELELQRDNGTEFIIRFNLTGNNNQELIPGQ